MAGASPQGPIWDLSALPYIKHEVPVNTAGFPLPIISWGKKGF